MYGKKHAMLKVLIGKKNTTKNIPFPQKENLSTQNKSSEFITKKLIRNVKENSLGSRKMTPESIMGRVNVWINIKYFFLKFLQKINYLKHTH